MTSVSIDLLGTLEVTGTHGQRAARSTISRAPCGALLVRIRVDRPVREQLRRLA
jgi:hypothetical protein